MGPETTAPPSPPARVGRQLGVGGEQVAGSSHARLGNNGLRPRERLADPYVWFPPGLRSECSPVLICEQSL